MGLWRIALDRRNGRRKSGHRQGVLSNGAAAHGPAFADFRGQIATVCQGAVHILMPKADTKALDIHAVAQTLHGVTPAECPAVDLFGKSRQDPGAPDNAFHGATGKRVENG